MSTKRLFALGLAAFLAAHHVEAQMVSGTRISGFAQTFALTAKESATFSVEFTGASIPANVLWPGEQGEFRFQVGNPTGQPINVVGKVRVVAYATKGRPGDIWTPDMYALGNVSDTSINVSIAPKGFVNLGAKPAIPERFGAYGLVLDLGDLGCQFITSCVRTSKPEISRPIQFPQLCLDSDDPDLLVRLGAAPNRMGIAYKPTTDPDFIDWYQKQAVKLQALKAAGLPITVEFGAGELLHKDQPLGRPRPHLDDKGVMKDTKCDMAWLPSYDADFQRFCKKFASEYGWPKGPINGMKLWNEPWEGMSISGWGADMIRYREIFTAMCQGVEQARQEAGVQVLLGGCDSTSNTFDKLFSDGSQDMLKWLDFCSIHYQGMFPPSTIKAWVNRQGPNGRVRIWDTESWVANTDDRVAAVVATNLSTGHDRAVGVYYGNIATEWHARRVRIKGDDGKPKMIERGHTWSVAASVAATTRLIGERKFKEMLFRNGLPWVMVFDGRIGSDGKADPEDGTVVVVGDIGDEFGHDMLLFRTARGFAEIGHKQQLRQQLAALPADAPAKEREALENAIAKPETLSGATMTLTGSGDRFSMYDFYGNLLPAENGRIVIPLDQRGFFLRGNGRSGSFAALLAALRTADVQGIEPLAKACHDMTSPVDQGATLRLSLTNVLNRPITGKLELSLGELTLEPATQQLTFEPDQTREVEVHVSGKPAADNSYPLSLKFDAGRDGVSTHQENLHVDYIVRQTIQVDGNLDDWKGAFPQTIRVQGPSGPTLTEQAWLPFEKFSPSLSKGLATAYLAYDQNYFYFAAKVADSTPDAGMPRFETRDDDAYFYPEKSYVVKRANTRVAPVAKDDTTTPKELTWPEGVRRYSYRSPVELPSGNAPNHDNVQIAFNVLPPDQKDCYPCPPGTMPGYIGYRDTDYEYALNPVAAKYGGGVEIWRLSVPGMPPKHFYPRQPKSPFDGPVKDGKLVIRREGNTRIVEAALPWSEIPDVRKAMEQGRTIKFSYRVNDNAGIGCMELSRGRSAAKRNTGTFHADWAEHWANELEFAFQK